MTTGFISAKLANMTVGSLYQYHCNKSYGFPSPGLQIGPVKFWKRSTAVAWVRKHKKRTGR
jgi:hypothetical protein